MKKSLFILFLAVVFAVPMKSVAQSDDPYYNAGYLIGSAIRQGVENRRARQAEEERRERERLEAERAYELEQQRIANERYAIQQREAEARRAEEERLRIAREAQKAEEERLRLLQEAQAVKNAEAAAKEYRESNRNVQVLTSNNSVEFLSDAGESIYLYVQNHSDGGAYLAYYNTDDTERRISCNRVNIRVKYLGDDREQSITDACSFIVPGNTAGSFELSDVFFSISDREVESIKIQFVDTQVR